MTAIVWALKAENLLQRLPARNPSRSSQHRQFSACFEHFGSSAPTNPAAPRHWSKQRNPRVHRWKTWRTLAKSSPNEAKNGKASWSLSRIPGPCRNFWKSSTSSWRFQLPEKFPSPSLAIFWRMPKRNASKQQKPTGNPWWHSSPRLVKESVRLSSCTSQPQSRPCRPKKDSEPSNPPENTSGNNVTNDWQRGRTVKFRQPPATNPKRNQRRRPLAQPDCQSRPHRVLGSNWVRVNRKLPRIAFFVTAILAFLGVSFSRHPRANRLLDHRHHTALTNVNMRRNNLSVFRSHSLNHVHHRTTCRHPIAPRECRLQSELAFCSMMFDFVHVFAFFVCDWHLRPIKTTATWNLVQNACFLWLETPLLCSFFSLSYLPVEEQPLKRQFGLKKKFSQTTKMARYCFYFNIYFNS